MRRALLALAFVAALLVAGAEAGTGGAAARRGPGVLAAGSPARRGLGVLAAGSPAGVAVRRLAGPATGVPGWRPDVAAARAFAAGREGSVTFAVANGHRLTGHGGAVTVRSASVVKAMLLVAYLRRPEVRARPLRGAERALLRPMIRVSDNRAATRAQARVGTPALVALARAAHMRRFTPSPAWGASRIDAADQARFFLRLEALLPIRHRSTALRWLQTIVPRQRWGIAPVSPPGWTLYFKGGWGSGSGAVTHQVALLARGEQRVAVAILTTANPSHAYGRVTVEGVARALVTGLEAP
jgi:hypothetical protein